MLNRIFDKDLAAGIVLPWIILSIAIPILTYILADKIPIFRYIDVPDGRCERKADSIIDSPMIFLSGLSDGSDFIMKIGLITKDKMKFETPFQGLYCRITYCVEYDKGIINGLFYIAGWVVAIALPLMLVFLIFRFYFIWIVLWTVCLTIISLYNPRFLENMELILYVFLLALHILILFYIFYIIVVILCVCKALLK